SRHRRKHANPRALTMGKTDDKCPSFYARIRSPSVRRMAQWQKAGHLQLELDPQTPDTSVAHILHFVHPVWKLCLVSWNKIGPEVRPKAKRRQHCHPRKRIDQGTCCSIAYPRKKSTGFCASGRRYCCRTATRSTGRDG